MEIASLRLIITEDDLNSLCASLVAPPPKIRDLRLYVFLDGLSMSGVYETILPIRFESFWTISVRDGKIAARSSGISVVGVRTNFLKDYILNAIAFKTDVIQLRDETFFIDMDRLLAIRGIPLRTNLISVRCEPGQLVIECRHV